MNIKRLREGNLPKYEITKYRILHTITVYGCINNIRYYKITRKDVYTKIEKSTTDNIPPKNYKQGKNYFTLEEAFKNIEMFEAREFNFNSKGYKCKGCNNRITWAELCDNCAGTDISMSKPLNVDNHEYPSRTNL